MKNLLFILQRNLLIILFSLILYMVPEESDAQNWCLTPTTSSYTEFDSIIQNRNEPGPFYLRIYVHVIRRTDGTGGQSVTDVYEALSYLDEAYSPHNIYFIWNGEIDYIDSDYYYNTPSAGIFNINRNNDGIDIYLFPVHFPMIYAQAEEIGSTAFYVAGKSHLYPFTSAVKSHVMSHEMGHCLNLYHPFHGPNSCWELVNGSNCDICGDLVCDTPAEHYCHFLGGQNVNPIDCSWENLIPACPVYDSTGYYNPDTKNIMTISRINCYAYFTQGQGKRMRNSIAEIDVLQACVLPISDSIIIGTKSWDSLVSIDGNIVIQTKSKLTITDTVLFLNEGKIIVKPGGKLVVDGGVITTNASTLWKGIDVWGIPSISQYLDSLGRIFQGQVVLKNGALIENARTGIFTGNREMEAIDYLYHGGIVMASSSEFRNNEVSIHLTPYENFHPVNEEPRSNLSYVKNCDFILSESDLAEFDPQIFIKLDGVSGISLAGNHFTNQVNGEVIPEITGIQSLNSSFMVDKACDDNLTPCQTYRLSTFENLLYGIKALGAATAKTFTVDTAIFTGNITGIYSSAIDNFSVIRSDFSVYNFDWESWGQEFEISGGIYIEDECDAFTIEENKFWGPKFPGGPQLRTSVGITFNNTGATDKELYNNTFQNLHTATLAMNVNRDIPGSGLCIRCNLYVNNDYDIAVIYDENLYDIAGIASPQGSSAPSPDAPAGNRFSWAGDANTPTDINNQAEHFIYYYHANAPAQFKLEPKYYTGVTIEEGDPEAYWDPEESCPSNLNPPGGGRDEEALRGLMADAGQEAESTQLLINALKDAGDTDALYWDVSMSAPWQNLEVFNELMSVAPYVSDSVLEAAIEKENVLVAAMIRDVLVANPHSAKSNALMEKLDQRIEPLPGYMLDEVLQGQSLVSVYEKLQSGLAYHRRKQALYQKQLVQFYLNDKANPQASTDSLVNLLLGSDISAHWYQAAFMRYEQGEKTASANILSSLPSVFGFNAEQLSKHADILALFEQENALRQQDKSLLVPDNQAAAWLMDMMDFGNEPTNIYARNILLAHGFVEHYPQYLLPDGTKSKKDKRPGRQIATADEALKLFPNPARDYVIIDFDLGSPKPANGNGILRVSNIEGKEIETLALNKTRDQIVFSLKDYKPGAYLFMLYYNGRMVDSKRLIIK